MTLAERLGADSSRVAAVTLLSTMVGFATFTGAAVLLQVGPSSRRW